MDSENVDGVAHDLVSLLTREDRDFLVRNNGHQVKVESLKGKKIWLYFSASWCGPCQRFTPKLVEAYNELSSNDDFEIIFVSGDNDDESFNGYFSKMPWLAIPFSDSDARDQLNELFKVMGIPNLVMLDESGKVLSEDGVEIIQEYGVEAYPFTPEKFAELEEIEKAKREAQTLESILVSGDRDFVIGKDGVKIPVSDLVGKNILLYFSAHWCPPCRAFLPKLIEAYQKIKTKDEAFEVIFISSDKDQTSFDEFFSGMPWLALPFGDKRKASLSRTFKVHGIPSLIAIGPTGRTVTTEVRNLVMIHGADAYPFTEEHIKEIEAQYEEMAKGWPEKMKHALHEEHELVLTKRRVYGCDGCEKQGHLWSFYCEECDFDLHPKCALEEDKGSKDEEMEKASPGEGWKCDGRCVTKLE
ncbi:probable nucleoredoxin 1 [Vitis riparia]|uniref:probable nucleoredoxin 1 n=1 Tax=Vitis riparia TaxID=96939 RepID=UPI00155A6F35|nr:probable nucleoredoxin 1 [Vitis riparia]